MKSLFLIALAVALLIGCMPLGLSLCDNSKCGELAGNWTYSWNDISGVQGRMVLEILPKFVQNSRETCAFDFNGKLKGSSWERSLSGHCYDDEFLTGSPLRAEGDEYTPGESAKKNFRIAKIDLNKGTLLYQNGSGYWEFSRVDQTKQPSADITIKVPDEVYHPLAINITLRENGKPVPNAKLKVHAFNLPDNDKKLAEYFLASSCINCPVGRTTIDGKTISTLCQYEVGLNLPCPLKEQKKPLEIATDANGEARMEFFLPLGKPDAILPKRDSPITIPLLVEYWKTNPDGKEIKIAEKKYDDIKLSSIAVVQEILYLEPQDFDGNGLELSRENGILSEWSRDEGVKDGDVLLKGSNRVKVNKAGMLGPNPEGRTAGTTLNKGDGLCIEDEVIINAGGMVSHVRGTTNPFATIPTSPTGAPAGAPGHILTAIRFFDGAVGAIQVDGEVQKHVVIIGESPSASGFKTVPENLVGLIADWSVDKSNVVKKGIKDAIKAFVPESRILFIIQKLNSAGEKLGVIDVVGKPVYIRIQSSVVTGFDDKDQLLVTTREGNATIYTEATGEEGFVVPAGKTVIVNETLALSLIDTDPETGQEADDLLAVLEDPIDTSPVFTEPGAAASGAASGTNGTATGSGAAGIPGVGNATAGNATSGTSAQGGPIIPGASGPGASTGGISTPSGNNQIGDAAQVSPGQSVSQTISPAGSSNFYGFQANSSGIIKLKLENVPEDMKPYLGLYDKNMASISEKTASNPGDTLALEKDVQGPGRFYIEVKDAQGKAYSEPYTLKIAFEPANDRYEPNPNYFRAAEVKSGDTINAYICPSGEEDFYKIYMDTSGIFKLDMDSVPEDMKAGLQLYDKGFGNEIAYSQASNPGDKVKLEKDVHGPGWFYIKVRDADGKAHSEPYTLKIGFEPAPDKYEPNPNFFRASEIEQGQSVTAYICPSGDEDFYKFHMGSSGLVKLTLNNVPEDMKAGLQLYDVGFGNEIAYSQANNPGDKVKLEKDVQGPGWFYIKVRDADGKAHSEPYTLIASFSS